MSSWSSLFGWWGGYGGGGQQAQNVVQNAQTGPSDVEGTSAPGQISVNARVEVSFELK